ncbi:hypothetical protein GF366_00095 [Candidatus Peregrinibacteria bacterium]|nr:hypothetical protein [Candidatus Peregrinibacteria bacterium]
MATVFFKINEKQEGEIEGLMEEEGYTNKAEFFRFLVKFFKYHKSPEDKRLENVTHKLAAVLKKLDEKGKLDVPLDDQLADV